MRFRSARCIAVLALVVGLIFVSAPLAEAQKPPAEELKALRPAEGLDAGVFAAEPLITNPAAIDVDTHGRVWVAEIQWYRGKAKQPPADKIKVLEDTNGDGVADKVTVFAEGLFCPMSVCVAGDKVFVATSPDLWVFEDKNGDLKADGPPKKLLTGFGGFNHDHGAHSLVLGPDHKWCMSHGDTGFNVTGTDGSKIKFQWGAMLRGELDGGKLETIAVNFRNPYEICMSSFGEYYCSDNDNDGNFSVRICWIMEGGDYGWFGGPPQKVPAGTPFGEHWHFRGHIPGYVPATLVTGFGSPCGICFHEGDAFGADYKNAPLHCDAGPREVRKYRHTPQGFGMKATNEVFLTSKGDDYFRPDDICVAPDGSLLVADWYDGGVGGHGYNNPDQGRIFRLTPKGKTVSRRGKPGPYSNTADAIEGLKSPNLATQYLARERLLADGAASLPALKALLADAEPNHRARALWVLDRIGGEGRKAVVDQLQNSEAAYRALAVRILRRRGQDHADAILALADDKSPEVVREVLLAIRTLTGEAAEAALARIARTYDGTDRYLLEAINVAVGPRKDAVLARLEKAGGLSPAQLPLLQLLNPQAAAKLVVARLSSAGGDPQTLRSLLEAAGTIAAPEAGRGVLKLAGDSSAPLALRVVALEKLNANLNGGWSSLRGDAELSTALRSALKSAESRRAALDLIGRHNLNQLAAEVLTIARAADADAGTRAAAMQIAVQFRSPEATPLLRDMLLDSDAATRNLAVKSLADLQETQVLREVLVGKNARYTSELRKAVVDRLAGSIGGALVLLRLIDAQQLSDELRRAAIAKAVNHPDANIRVLYERFIPADQRPKRLGEAFQPADILKLKGDPRRGEKVYAASSAAQCKACHKVRGNGAAIGPDLSQIGKKYERGALLETILEPSKAVAPEFVAYLLETTGGKVYAGFLAEKTDQLVTLKDVQGNQVRVPTAEIEVLEPQQKSLMPELVLREMTAQDAADLLAYLESLR